MFLNNFLPSRKDWEDRKHLDFEEWPTPGDLFFNNKVLKNHELAALESSQFGQAVLKNWLPTPTGKCDFAVPIVCDIDSAKDPGFF